MMKPIESSEGRGNREHLSSAKAAAPPDPEVTDREQIRQELAKHGPGVLFETDAFTFEPDDLLALLTKLDQVEGALDEILALRENKGQIGLPTAYEIALRVRSER